MKNVLKRIAQANDFNAERGKYSRKVWKLGKLV